MKQLRQAVRHDPDISMSASCMFEDICDMHEAKGCWATDEHFADRYDVHEETAARWRRELQSSGYLQCEQRGDEVHLIPNNKIVVEQQNDGQATDSLPQKDGSTTNSSQQNRGTQRDKYTHEECESAPAHEAEIEENTDAPVTMEKAIQIGEMVGVAERLCREWWLYYDERGWPHEVHSVPSALRKWKMNDEKFSDNGGGGDGAPAGGKSHTERFGDQDVVHFGQQ